jgi:hypothetical protein
VAAKEAAAPPATALPGRRTQARVAGLAGLAFVVLYVAGFVILGTSPAPSGSDEEITSFYAGDGSRLLTVFGAYIVPFAGIAFLWFTSAVRIVFITEPAKRAHVLAPMQFATGILFVAAAFLAAAAMAASATAIEFAGSPADLDPGLLRAFPQLAYSIMFIFGIRMAGVFIATTSALGRGLLPGWLRIVGFVLAAALLLSVSFIELLVLLIPAWVAVISAWLLVVLAREGVDDAEEAAQGRLGNDA